MKPAKTTHEWGARYSEPVIRKLPDEVISIDLPEIDPVDDFEITEPDGDAEQIQMDIQNQREANPTMLDVNVHSVFEVFISDDRKAEIKVGCFATETLAEKVGKFYETEFNSYYKIYQQRVYVSATEFVEAQGVHGDHADRYLRLLSPEARRAFLKRRALAKLTQEEREILGL